MLRSNRKCEQFSVCTQSCMFCCCHSHFYYYDGQDLSSSIPTYCRAIVVYSLLFLLCFLHHRPPPPITLFHIIMFFFYFLFVLCSFFHCRYGRWVTRRVAVLSIVTIWLLAGLVSFVPISFSLHRPDQPLVYEDNGKKYPTCALDLTPTYAVVSSCISFYVPCIVMIGIYCR